MANLILRANILNENINIQHKVLSLPLDNNKVELSISPKANYTIRAEQFSHGLLPSQISTMSFSQVGKNVIAIIDVSEHINNKVPQNVSLPIMADAKLNIDSFKLVDLTFEKDNIIFQGNSSFFKSTNSDKDTYSVNVKLGEKILVLSKTIASTNGFYFNVEPTYGISGNSNRYTSVERSYKNTAGNITRKTFDIYYSAPLDLLEETMEDTIRFSASVTEKGDRNFNKVVTKKEDYEIYSFDGGRTIGTMGGNKVMKVRGVPGSQFKIILQNDDKKTYNFDTGVFEHGGGMLLGEIPQAVDNLGYGEYIVIAKIAKSSTNSSIKTIFTTDAPIDHNLLKDKLEKDKLETSVATAYDPKIKASTTPIFEDRESFIASRFTFAFSGTGLEVEKLISTLTSNFTDTTILTEYGNYNESTDNISFTSTVSSTDLSKVINIDRQPLSTDWTQSPTTVGGSYVTDTSVASYGPLNAAGRSTSVTLKGQITGLKYGKGDSTITLALTNFLTLHSI